MMTSNAGLGELVRELRAASPCSSFQRACEANARFFTTVSETLDVLLNLGR